MRNFLNLVLIVVFVYSTSSFNLVNAININQGTPINITFPYLVDGGNLDKGASIVVTVGEDFIQDGKLIFKSGETGTVTVDESEGRKLTLGGGYLKATNGDKVQISLNKKAKGKGVASNPSFWIGLLLFWPALFFIRTKEATIPAGTTAQAFVMQDTNLNIN